MTSINGWLLSLALLLFAGCGPRFRAGTVDAGDPCTAPAQCPIGFTCVGCSQTDRRCLQGCETDEDCAFGPCAMVECTTCPCPGTCG